MKNTKKRDNRCTINFKKKHQIWTTINEHWKQSKNFWNNDYSPPCRRPSSPQTCSTSACHRRCHQGPGKPALTARRCLFLTKTRTQANTKTNTNIKTEPRARDNSLKCAQVCLPDKDKDKYTFEVIAIGDGGCQLSKWCNWFFLRIYLWQCSRQISVVLWLHFV